MMKGASRKERTKRSSQGGGAGGGGWTAEAAGSKWQEDTRRGKKSQGQPTGTHCEQVRDEGPAGPRTPDRERGMVVQQAINMCRMSRPK